MDFSVFYQMPLFFGGLILFALLLVALEAGYRIGVKQRKQWLDADTGGERWPCPRCLRSLG